MRVLPFFILSLFAAAAFADEECPPRYSYCGYSGPTQWPNIKIENKTNECGGARQSPIVIPFITTPVTGPWLKFEYIAGNATIQNTGHDILVTPTGDAGVLKIGNDAYKLVQFHFHFPPEHIVATLPGVVEMHIVHQLADNPNGFKVVSVMLVPGSSYPAPALKAVFANFPGKACTKSEAKIDFDKLLPNMNWSYYFYAGSLTTPPCSQSVAWYILFQPGNIDPLDMKKLSDLGTNARPTQNNNPPLPVSWVVNPSK